MAGVQLTAAALRNVEETSVNVAADLADLRAGAVTPEALLEQCLDGADDDRVPGWRDYVSALAAEALPAPAPSPAPPQACPYDPYPDLPDTAEIPQVCHDDNVFHVECPCGAKGPECTTRQEAIDRWNSVGRLPTSFELRFTKGRFSDGAVRFAAIGPGDRASRSVLGFGETPAEAREDARNSHEDLTAITADLLPVVELSPAQSRKIGYEGEVRCVELGIA